MKPEGQESMVCVRMKFELSGECVIIRFRKVNNVPGIYLSVSAEYRFEISVRPVPSVSIASQHF